MKLCVIGTGYVGLVGAPIFSEWGNEVVGVDIDQKKIDRINSGDMPIFEPGLEELVKKEMEKGTLTFTTDLEAGISDAEIIFICVGTPQYFDGSADLSAVWSVAENIGKLVKPGDPYRVIVTKSTVPVGTNERVEEIVRENAPEGYEFDVASNPEFLREGSSIKDMRNTDRTVVGSNSQRAHDKMAKLYSVLDAPLVQTDLRSSEMIKYASNTFLAMKITFINEMAQLCDRTGADVKMVAKGMGMDNRIGPKFLNASIGYGGGCFPKDVAALHKTSSDNSFEFKLLEATMAANEIQAQYFANKVLEVFGEDLSGLTFGALGLAFKGNTDDVRKSPAIKVIRKLRGYGASFKVYDPEALETGKADLGETSVEYVSSIEEAMSGTDSLLILTEWKQFGEIDPADIKKAIRTEHVFDGRNMLDPKEVEALGLRYYGVGRTH